MIVDTVTVAGRLIDPELVLSDVQVEHGRGGFGADPEASRASITVRTSTLPSWAAGGDLITLAGPYGPVFTGRITDLGVVHPADGVADVTITAIGMLADLGRATIGDEPWPPEAAQTRAGRILTKAAPPFGWEVQAPGVEGRVIRRDVDAKTPLDLLTELTATTGGAVFDTPEGTIVYQPEPSRQNPVFTMMWRDIPAADTWATWWAGTWNGIAVSPRSRPVVILDACVIEWEPKWAMGVGAVVNAARVVYGPPGEDGQTSDRPVVTVEDAASIDRHARREARIDSQWVEAVDAGSRARQIVTTQARARWETDGAVVILDEADPATRAAVVGLRCGDRVQLTGLPSPSPATGRAWTGIVEGWSLTQTVDDGGQMARITLRLSDPLLSLLVERWRDAPTGLQWAHLAPDRAWHALEHWEAA